jgi:hypothetical protein
MTRIFLDETQIEELDNFDIFEDLDDIFEDDFNSMTESKKSDWFGVDDPEI